MKCPACPDTTLSMSNREGIEIDYCPKCRGVWLDRGELDKIIERTMTLTAAPAPAPAAPPPQAAQPDPRNDPRYAQADHQSGYRKYDDDDDYRKHHYGKRRRGLLGDLFDFD